MSEVKIHTKSKMLRIRNRIARVFKCMQPRRVVALTLGRHVFVAADRIPVTTLAHELVHVEQYQRHGFFGFLWRYFRQALKHSYRDIPLEVEAYQRESDPRLLRQARDILAR